jgi:hypothetical protein
MSLINRVRKFWIICFVFLLVLSSCIHRTPASPAAFVRDGRFSYLKDQDGRWFIVTMNTKDLEAAMKKIQPGPASVDKLKSVDRDSSCQVTCELTCRRVL